MYVLLLNNFFFNMWYEEQNQFVRAKTPQTFDRLVQELEDGDSVLFDSISLPKSNPNIQNQSLPPSQEQTRKEVLNKSSSEPINSNDNLNDDNDEIDDLDNLISMRDASNKITSKSEKKELIIQLKEKLRKTELEGKKKLEILRSKDQKILALQRELNEAQARLNGEDQIQSQSRSQESVEFYKGKYESALLDFENLKKSLKADGKIKRVSARAVKPITPKLSQ